VASDSHEGDKINETAFEGAPSLRRRADTADRFVTLTLLPCVAHDIASRYVYAEESFGGSVVSVSTLFGFLVGVLDVAAARTASSDSQRRTQVAPTIANDEIQPNYRSIADR